MFEVPAPLHGYRSSTKRSLWTKRNREYSRFKDRVLALAMERGWKGKAESRRDFPIRLSVIVHWRRGPRIDWKNVYGGIEDALFSGDRFVIPGAHSSVIWDTSEPESATVVLEW